MHYDIQWNLNGSDNQFPPPPHDPSPFNPQQPDILAIPLSEILMKANLGTAHKTNVYFNTCQNTVNDWHVTAQDY
jgi:hypothetical protein